MRRSSDDFELSLCAVVLGRWRTYVPSVPWLACLPDAHSPCPRSLSAALLTSHPCDRRCGKLIAPNLLPRSRRPRVDCPKRPGGVNCQADPTEVSSDHHRTWRRSSASSACTEMETRVASPRRSRIISLIAALTSTTSAAKSFLNISNISAG